MSARVLRSLSYPNCAIMSANANLEAACQVLILQTWGWPKAEVDRVHSQQVL